MFIVASENEHIQLHLSVLRSTNPSFSLINLAFSCVVFNVLFLQCSVRWSRQKENHNGLIFSSEGRNLDYYE